MSINSTVLRALVISTTFQLACDVCTAALTLTACSGTGGSSSPVNSAAGSVSGNSGSSSSSSGGSSSGSSSSSSSSSGGAAAQASINKWTWVSGSNQNNAIGVYGTLGAAAVSNAPGARHGGASWLDAAGNLWVFGGFVVDGSDDHGLNNDLWKYTVSTGEWTWISGSNVAGALGVYGTLGTPAADNVPGARQNSVSWMDSAGNLWLFGGQGLDANGLQGALNDLWRFSPASGTWIWVSGSNVNDQPESDAGVGSTKPSNNPGARSGSAAWADKSGNLWLFGGFGMFRNQQIPSAASALHDLWKYNIASGLWTLVNYTFVYNTGSDGSYGTLRQAAAGNVPPSRNGAATWIDAAGNLWLFGGAQFYYGSFPGEYNDLWQFNPTLNQWIWMGGSQTLNAYGTYGVLGSASATAIPGARDSGLSWADAAGNLWLFGGNGLDGSGSSPQGSLNDLWKFNPSTNQWTWVSGSSSADMFGTYGTQGSASRSNVPGARSFTYGGVDGKGNVWLFGGMGLPASQSASLNTNRGAPLSDLWVYMP